MAPPSTRTTWPVMVAPVIRLGDDYPHSWTMPYTQNTDLGKAQAQYPVPGEPPKCECDNTLGKGVSKTALRFTLAKG